ncbi:hypothetical protein J6590_078656 [Homalodisca vitripennis]|nr:hypothetical protein J6590_078656 [Homalodisca vitripennis]
MELSETDRINILIMRGYGDLKRSYQTVADLFHERFPNRPPISKNGVVTTVRRFEENATVKDLRRNGRPKTATNEDMATDETDETVVSLCFDLQQIQQLPKSNIQNAYYLRQFNFYSLCITSLDGVNPTFYTWTEELGGKGSTEILSALPNLKGFKSVHKKVVIGLYQMMSV